MPDPAARFAGPTERAQMSVKELGSKILPVAKNFAPATFEASATYDHSSHAPRSAIPRSLHRRARRMRAPQLEPRGRVHLDAEPEPCLLAGRPRRKPPLPFRADWNR